MSEAVPTELDLTPKERTLIDQMHRTLEQGSYYILLGVSEEADAKEIRKAYYDLSRHWHPDRFFRREVGDFAPKIEAIFSAITLAYQTLSDDKKRERYDKERMEQEDAAGRGTSRRRRRRRTAVEAPEPPVEASPEPSAEASTAIGSGTGENGTGQTVSAEATTSAGESAPESSHASRASRISRRANRLTPRARSQYRQKVISKVRDDVVENIRRAKIYYEAGKKDLAEGQPLKAESSLYLAVKLDPRNETYRSLLDEAHEQSLQIRAQQFMNAAESAESYQNIQEALYNYRKAAEYKSRNGAVYYRLAQLIRRFEKDTREALQHLRTAVQYTPDNAEYRIALAEVYAELDLGLNARREYQEAGKHTDDKATRERIKEGLRAIR